jgi:transcriptional regulator with XRE-family HTH domain
MPRKRIAFADHLRQFVLESGITRYRISKDTGIDEATLSRFLNHKGFLSEAKLNVLAEYLDLELRKRQ